MDVTNNKLKKLGIITGTKGVSGKLILAKSLAGLHFPAGAKFSVGFSENFCEVYKLACDIVTYSKKTELQLIEVTTKEQAETYKEQAVFVQREIVLTHNPDYMFADEILGLSVIDLASDKNIGTIIEIWELPANDVWLVETPGGNLPLPVIDDVIKSIDLKSKIVKVLLLEGLMDIIVS